MKEKMGVKCWRRNRDGLGGREIFQITHISELFKFFNFSIKIQWMIFFLISNHLIYSAFKHTQQTWNNNLKSLDFNPIGGMF